MYDGCLKVMFSEEDNGTMSVECFYFDSEGVGIGAYGEGDSPEDLLDVLMDFAEGLLGADEDEDDDKDDDDLATAYDELADDYDELLENYKDLYNDHQELKNAYDILFEAAKEQEAKLKEKDTRLKEEDETKRKEKVVEPKMTWDALVDEAFLRTRNFDDFCDYLLSHYDQCK